MRNPINLAGIIFTIFTSYVPSGSAQWIWAKESFHEPYEYGPSFSSITADRFGNVYNEGWFGNPTLAFDSVILTKLGGGDMYVVKYDSNGNLIWGKNFGGYSNVIGTAMTTDSSGNVYITGGYGSGHAIFGADTLLASGYYEVFTIKCNMDGDVLWAKQSSSVAEPPLAQNYSTDVCVSSLDEVFVTGIFASDSISFDSILLEQTVGINFFLTKYDSEGDVLWAVTSLGESAAQANAVTVDDKGNVYIAGFFEFDNFIIGTDTFNSVNGSQDLFITKYNSEGTFQWAKHFGGSGSERIEDITMDESGHLCVTGYYTSDTLTLGSFSVYGYSHFDVFVARLDSTGNPLWLKSARGPNEEQGNRVACDYSGNIYVTGYFSSPFLDFGSVIYYDSTNNFSMFIAKFDSLGNVSCVSSLKTEIASYDFAVVFDQSRSVYVGGDYSSSNFIVGNDTLDYCWYTNVFTAKFWCDPELSATTDSHTETLTVFPSLVQNVLYIDLENQFINPIITVFDLQGRNVSLPTTILNSKVQLNTERLPNGFYILQVTDRYYGTTSVAKFIKE